MIVIEQAAKERVFGAADYVKRPERPELAGGVGLVAEAILECGSGQIEDLAADGLRGEDAPGLPHEPFIRMPVKRDQLGFRKARQIGGGCLRSSSESDLVDPARRAMDAVVIVAIAGIAPVQNEHTSVGPVAQVDAAKPGIGGEQDIRLV